MMPDYPDDKIIQNIRVDISRCVKIEGNSSSKGATTFGYYRNEEFVPSWYIKIPRDPLMGHYIDKEAEVLISLRHQFKGIHIADVIPQVIGYTYFGKSRAIVISAVYGNVMSHCIRSERIRMTLRTAADWLAMFHKATNEAYIELSSTSINYLFESCFEYLDFNKRNTIPYSQIRDSIEQLQPQIVDGLLSQSGIQIPLSTIHGDFSVHNLLCNQERITGVIDWGESKKIGVIFEDVYHFLFVLLTSKKVIRLGNNQFTPANVWKQLKTFSPLIMDYLRRYSQLMDIDHTSMIAFIPWYFYVTALKDLLPWRLNIPSTKFWLDLAVASALDPLKRSN